MYSHLIALWIIFDLNVQLCKEIAVRARLVRGFCWQFYWDELSDLSSDLHIKFITLPCHEISSTKIVQT